MLLAASASDDEVKLVLAPDGCEPGELVTFDGHTSEPMDAGNRAVKVCVCGGGVGELDRPRVLPPVRSTRRTTREVLTIRRHDTSFQPLTTEAASPSLAGHRSYEPAIANPPLDRPLRAACTRACLTTPP